MSATKEHILHLLRKEVAKAGSQKRLAENLGVSPAFVSDCLRGNRNPTGKLLAKVGYQIVISYKRTAPMGKT